MQFTIKNTVQKIQWFWQVPMSIFLDLIVTGVHWLFDPTPWGYVHQIARITASPAAWRPASLKIVAIPTGVAAA